MHELSIAVGIIEEISSMPEIKRKKIREIHLTVGDLSGVSVESLAFAFDVAKEKTSLAKSRLIIKKQPIIIFCLHCKIKARPEKTFSLECPVCKKISPDIIKGKELIIQKIKTKNETQNYSNQKKCLQ